MFALHSASVLILCVLSASGSLMKDMRSGDPLALREARCKAKCVAKSLKSMFSGAEDACQADRVCNECFRICENLAASYYSLKLMCHRREVCGEGCRLACHAMKKYHNQDIPDRRRGWSWSAPRISDLVMDQEKELLYVIEWKAPSVAETEKTHTEIPIYNILWKDSTDNLGGWKTLMNVIDPFVEVYRSETAVSLTVQVQAVLTTGVIGAFKRTLEFPQSGHKTTPKQRVPPHQLLKEASYSTQGSVERTSTERSEGTTTQTRDPSVKEFLSTSTTEQVLPDTVTEGPVIKPRPTALNARLVVVNAVTQSPEPGQRSTARPTTEYPSDRYLFVAIGISLLSALFAAVTVIIFIWWEVKGRRMYQRGIIWRNSEPSLAAIYASSFASTPIAHSNKLDISRLSSVSTSKTSITSDGGSQGTGGLYHDVRENIMAHRSKSMVDLRRLSVPNIKTAFSFGFIATEISCALATREELQDSRGSGSGVWV